MKKWIETQYNIIEIQKQDLSSINHSIKYSRGIENIYSIVPDYEELAIKMDALTKEINEKGMEIKAIIPLQEGFGKTFAKTDSYMKEETGYSWGFGHGFGFSPTSAILIVAQNVEEITTEEYDARVKLKSLNAKLTNAEHDLEKKRSEQEQLESRLAAEIELFKQNQEIEEKNKLLGSGVVFICGTCKFKTKEEAENYRQSFYDKIQATKQELSQYLSKINSMEKDMDIINQDIHKLEEINTSGRI
ncbi:hypothetical protein [Dethiosulfatarculus sandiegensis]|uniref:Uncharacterized protein n=1 Tax=Dethiosulfatarculus sandiegensis TaxID=1429043 RepID=A0A0D2JKC7_9BACT|nr:hypothetical protein [Dethiosulfatarculus sandiegensis]KIX16101.1 hypothetical protein X474_01255 [Dethiosulfatarculus sandiegensis]